MKCRYTTEKKKNRLTTAEQKRVRETTEEFFKLSLLYGAKRAKEIMEARKRREDVKISDT